jgi:hypothetical protein
MGDSNHRWRGYLRVERILVLSCLITVEGWSRMASGPITRCGRCGQAAGEHPRQQARTSHALRSSIMAHAMLLRELLQQLRMILRKFVDVL